MGGDNSVIFKDIGEAKKCRVDGSDSDCHRSILNPLPMMMMISNDDDDDSDTDYDGAESVARSISIGYPPMMIMMKVMITTVISMMMMTMRDVESAITDDDDVDDDANDMQSFHPGNLDWIGELRNLLTPHEVYLMCRNMWKN